MFWHLTPPAYPEMRPPHSSFSKKQKLFALPSAVLSPTSWRQWGSLIPNENPWNNAVFSPFLSTWRSATLPWCCQRSQGPGEASLLSAGTGWVPRGVACVSWRHWGGVCGVYFLVFEPSLYKNDHKTRSLCFKLLWSGLFWLNKNPWAQELAISCLISGRCVLTIGVVFLFMWLGVPAVKMLF